VLLLVRKPERDLAVGERQLRGAAHGKTLDLGDDGRAGLVGSRWRSAD
jgi:hypothetical protein